MLGLNLSSSEINRKLEAIGNFLVFLVIQMLFQLYELLTLNRYPTEYEIYRAIILSAVATVIFYGYNKVAVKSTTMQDGGSLIDGTTFEIYIATLEPQQQAKVRTAILKALKESGYSVEVREVHYKELIK